MAGSVLGGKAAAITNKRKYGEDFYKRIGIKGGSASHPTTRPFALNRELAKVAGAKGGRTSRKPKKERIAI